MASTAQNSSGVKFVGLREKASPQKGFSYDRPNSYFTTQFNRTAQDQMMQSDLEIDVPKTGGTISFLNYPLNQRVEKAFQYISVLKDNWDSYGAAAPTSDVIESAKRASSFFPSHLQPEIQPEADGSIGLYWDQDMFSYAIQILSNNSFEWFIEPKDGEKMVGKKAPLDVVLNSFLSTFFSK